MTHCIVKCSDCDVVMQCKCMGPHVVTYDRCAMCRVYRPASLGTALSCATTTATPVDTEQRNLAIGDIVRLKSGGPRMTVVGLSGDQVACEWCTFSQAYPANSTFHRLTLCKYETENPGIASGSWPTATAVTISYPHDKEQALGSSGAWPYPNKDGRP